MRMDLKENIPHGTKEYPYTQYYLINTPRPHHIPVHWHEEFEIIYITKGNIILSINDISYTGKTGDIFIVNPADLHFMEANDTTPTYYTVLFPLEFISFRTDDNLEENLLKPLRLGNIKYKNHIEDKKLTEELKEILDKLTSLDHTIAKDHFKCRILLLTFFQLLYEYEHPIYNISNLADTERQREIIDFIQGNFQNDLSLARLAEHFHTSEKYFSRYFKEHFRINFSVYLMHQRLTNAKKLLEQSDLSITDIALNSGFQNISYFIRSFHNNYGMSPLQYRKQSK